MWVSSIIYGEKQQKSTQFCGANVQGAANKYHVPFLCCTLIFSSIYKIYLEYIQMQMIRGTCYLYILYYMFKCDSFFQRQRDSLDIDERDLSDCPYRMEWGNTHRSNQRKRRHLLEDERKKHGRCDVDLWLTSGNPSQSSGLIVNMSDDIWITVLAYVSLWPIGVRTFKFRIVWDDLEVNWCN